MASSYPSTFDNLTNPTASDKTNSATVPHATQHSNLNDIAESVQHKLGLSTSGAGGSSYPSTNVGDVLLVNSTGGHTAWGSPAPAFRNRILNGAMRVKQRNTLSTADNAYTLDRWRAIHEGGMIVTQETSDVPASTTVGGSNRAIKFQFDGSSGHKGGIFQPIESFNCEDLKGQRVSVQFKAKVGSTALSELRAAIMASTNSSADDTTLANDPVSAWGGGGTNPTPSGSWVNAQAPSTFTPSTNYSLHKIEDVLISTAMKNLGLMLWSDDTSNSTTDFVLISDVQLEKGRYCSEYERRPVSMERDDCEYYMQAFGGGVAFPIQCFGVGLDSTIGDFGPLIKRPMRGSPTMTITSTDWAGVKLGSPITLASASILFASPTGVWFRGLASTAVGAFSSNAAMFLVNNSASVSQIILSAEL